MTKVLIIMKRDKCLVSISISYCILNRMQSSFCPHHSVKTGLVKIINIFLVIKPQEHISIPFYSISEHHLLVLNTPPLKHYPLLGSVTTPSCPDCLSGCVIFVPLMAISLLNIGVLKVSVWNFFFFISFLKWLHQLQWLNCDSWKSYIEVLTISIWLYLEVSLLGGDLITMRPLGWVLIQSDSCCYKKKKFGH